MFSKEEAKKLRQEFWTAFGKSFPRKWILYDTKIKDMSFKFHFDRRSAKVSIDIEESDPEWRALYYEKWFSLKSLLEKEIKGIQFCPHFELENGKEIARIYIELPDVSIHDKNSWQSAMLFLKEQMEKLESIWFDFEDFIKS